MRGVSSESDSLGSLGQTGILVNDYVGEVIGTGDDSGVSVQFGVGSVHHVDVRAVPLGLEYSLNRPAQNAAPGAPVLVS